MGWDDEIEIFIENGKLNYLQECGFLNRAVDVYIEADMVIDPIYRMAGSWNDHLYSWSRRDDAVITIKYEDMLCDSAGAAVRISEVVPTEPGDILKAIGDVTDCKVRREEESLSFYNMARSWYCLEYIPEKLIEKFRSKYRDVLLDSGYYNNF